MAYINTYGICYKDSQNGLEKQIETIIDSELLLTPRSDNYKGEDFRDVTVLSKEDATFTIQHFLLTEFVCPHSFYGAIKTVHILPPRAGVIILFRSQAMKLT